MEVPSFPWRLDPQGHIVTVTQGSDDHATELVAHLLYTRKGERDLVPDFGITDPVFAGVDSAELSVTVKTFGPLGVRVAITDDTQIDERLRATTVAIEREA